MNVVIVSIDDSNGFLRVSFKKVPKEEYYSSHSNNVRRIPDASSEDFKMLADKLPKWIEETLEKAKKESNDD